jgi:hypothetical protein
MDLYQQLYVPRPVVVPELFASLRPPTYTGATDGNKKLPPDAVQKAQRELPAPKEAAREELGADWGRPAGGGKQNLEKSLRDDLNLAQGVRAAAAAGELGDYFQYVLDHPVSLPRQKSALLPIVQKDVQAERVSIYNEQTQAKHPLLGLKFTNTTGLHLMQGPVTVFEGSSYAGDSRVLDLQPKEERLLSYAIDLGTEVEPVAKRDPDRLTKVKVNKGILYQTTKVRESKRYNVKNRSEHDRTLLLEHPFRADFALVSKDQPAERARDVYRFELKVPAGHSASEEVVEEQDVLSTVQLTNADDQSMRFFLSQPVVSEAVKKALGKALELKGTLSATQREIAEQERHLKTIVDDQGRLRANLREMPPTAEAYKRYLKKFDDQETQIEDFQKKIKALQGQEFQQRQTFEDFLAKLDVE